MSGDPETQAVLALLDSPLGQLLHAAGTGKLADFGELRWRDGAAVTVVLAAENYPGRPRVGDVIVGSEVEGVLHAGTARRDDGAIVLVHETVVAGLPPHREKIVIREHRNRLTAVVRPDGEAELARVLKDFREQRFVPNKLPVSLMFTCFARIASHAYRLAPSVPVKRRQIYVLIT